MAYGQRYPNAYFCFEGLDDTMPMAALAFLKARALNAKHLANVR